MAQCYKGFILGNYIELKYERSLHLPEDLITPEFDHFIVTAQIMGRDIYDLLSTNPISIEQIKEILIAKMIDEEYSRLALCLKEGGISSYAVAYKCIKALIKGLSDK